MNYCTRWCIIVKKIDMKDSEQLKNDLKFIDDIVGYILPDYKIDLYLAGGSACILAGYLDRATNDFDIIDIGYTSTIGKILNYLQPYDLLDIRHAEIPIHYMDRAIKLEDYNNINVFVLSKEDIIASKIGRYSEKDKNDIKILLKDIELELLKESIVDTISGIINVKRKDRYIIHLYDFKCEFNIDIEV